MARICSTGFELNSLTQYVEFNFITGSPTITTSPVRSGAYSLKIASLTSGVGKYVQYQFDNLGVKGGPFYYRTYIVAYPAVTNDIFDSGPVWFTLNSSGQLILNDTVGTVGSPSAALSLNRWYRIEMQTNHTPASGSRVAEGLVDGVVFATSSTRSFDTATDRLSFGGNLEGAANATGEWYFDDIAVNDSTGSYQNSYPGEGSIIHLRSNSPGDNGQWTNTGFANVSEVTPDDGVTQISSKTTNQIDDYNVDNFPVSISSINVIQVGIRGQGGTNGTDSSFVVRLKANSQGTVAESSPMTPTSIWTTNGSSPLSPPWNYKLTSYVVPGGSIPWNTNDVFNAQIGVRCSNGNTDFSNVSTIWMLVDYVPSSKIRSHNKLRPRIFAPGLAR